MLTYIPVLEGKEERERAKERERGNKDGNALESIC